MRTRNSPKRGCRSGAGIAWAAALLCVLSAGAQGPAAVCVDLLSEAGLPLFTNVHNCARAMRVMADYRAARAAFKG